MINMSQVQPQTIEAADGFPARNKNFNNEYWFYGELMAVATGCKPLAIESIDQVKFKYAGTGRWSDTRQVAAACRQANLHYIPYAADNVIVFQPKYLADAVLLQQMGLYADGVLKPDSIPGLLYHIIEGILLGYNMEDIRAFQAIGALSTTFNCTYSDEERKRLVKDPIAKLVLKTCKQTFVALYSQAVKLIPKLLKLIKPTINTTKPCKV